MAFVVVVVTVVVLRIHCAANCYGVVVVVVMACLHYS